MSHLENLNTIFIKIKIVSRINNNLNFLEYKYLFNSYPVSFTDYPREQKAIY